MREPRERLQDIVEAVEAIRRHVRTRDQFAQDELIQVWVVHHLSIIGEAASRVPDDWRAKSTMNWPAVVAMRNILVHHYFGIDLDAVWAVIERDPDVLKADVRQLLRDPV